MITLVRLGAFFDPLAIFWVLNPILILHAPCDGPCRLGWPDYLTIAALVAPIVIGIAALVIAVRRESWRRLRRFERGLALAEIAIGIVFAFLAGVGLPSLLERFFAYL